MTQAPFLTEDLLEALYERWSRLGAPIAQTLRPGLSDDEMESLVAPLGLRLPDEARVWWGWHDGVDDERLSHGLGNYIVPRRLAQAVDWCEELRRIAADLTADESDLDPEHFWRREWFPLAAAPKADIACDCSVRNGQPAPVLYVEFQYPEESREPAAPSLGGAVQLWIDVIDSGGWTYDPARPPGWVTRPDLLPHIDGRARMLVE